MAAMKRKLIGSTLLEVVTSLGLLSLVFVLATMVIGSLSEASQLEWMRVRTWARSMLEEPIPEFSPRISDHTIGPYRLERTIEQLGDGLQLVEVTCYEEETVLYKRSKWISID